LHVKRNDVINDVNDKNYVFLFINELQEEIKCLFHNDVFIMTLITILIESMFREKYESFCVEIYYYIFKIGRGTNLLTQKE